MANKVEDMQTLDLMVQAFCEKPFYDEICRECKKMCDRIGFAHRRLCGPRFGAQMTKALEMAEQYNRVLFLEKKAS